MVIDNEYGAVVSKVIVSFTIAVLLALSPTLRYTIFTPSPTVRLYFLVLLNCSQSDQVLLSMLNDIAFMPDNESEAFKVSNTVV